MKNAASTIEIRRVPKQARSRERYERILDAARSLIAARGNDAVSMREIADKSGMPVSSVYQYFPDKNSLLWTLISGNFERLESEWLGQLAAAGSVEETNAAARDLFDAFVSLCERDSSFAKLWNSAQANAVLSELDRALNERVATAYAEKLGALIPTSDTDRIRRTTLLTATLSSAAIQLAFSDPTIRDGVLDDFRELMEVQAARTIQKGSPV